MVVLQVAVVVGLVVLFVVGMAQLTGGPRQLALREVVGRPGRWRVGHYEKDDATWVVVQRVAPKDEGVLDEHLVATIDAADPAYEEKFLEAMQAARHRQAIFEAEDD